MCSDIRSVRNTPEREAFSYHPLLPIAIFFTTGILIQNTVHFGGGALLGLIAGSTLLTVIFLSRRFSVVFLMLAFAALGALALLIENYGIREDRIRSLIDSGRVRSGEAVELEGRLIAPPELMPTGFELRVATDAVSARGQKIAASGTVRLFGYVTSEEARAEYESLELHRGSRVAVACNIFREEQYQNPGVISRIELLDRRGFDASGNVKSPLLIQKLDDPTYHVPFGWIYDVRQTLIRDFQEHFTSSTEGVLIASLLGDKYFLDKRTADEFREGGTFHVLVISGLHITFIGGFLLFVVRDFTHSRSWHFLTVSAVLWSYALAVGAEPPVVRACLMFTILLFSHAIYRRGTLLNALAACVILLLAWRPGMLFDPSFQLTIVSVAAIVAIAFPLIEKLRAVGAWMPSPETPFPPNVDGRVRRFCEMLYWRPIVWDIESSRQVWTAGIFKDPYLPTLAAISGGQRIAGYVFEGLLISAVVQVFLLPLLVVYFHRVSPVSLLLNLWVGSVLALESFTALSAVLLSNVSSFLAAPVISVTELLNYLMIRAHAVLPQSEWGSWRVPNYSGWMRWIYVIYFVPLVPLSIALYKWDPFRIARLTASHTNEDSRDTSSDNRPLYGFPCLRSVIVVNAAAVILLAVVIVFHPFSAPRPDGRLHIEQLDVGQGDSSLVTFPDGTTMLVDGGGRMRFQDSDGDDTADVFIPDSPGIGEAVVSPVLWEKGYSAIDHIVATHADADHVDGLADIVSNFRVGTAFFGRFPTADPELAGLIEALRSRGVPVEIVSRGDTLTIGDAFVEILYPLYDASPDAPSDNDHSVVVRIVYGNRAFLLTGDIERRGEMQLLSGGGDLSADVVKVAHHGSQTSSTPEFVSAVGARYAVISVGKRSNFGHPHRDVVERWQSAGARVMTTGEKGMISISTDGRDLEVRTFTEQK